MPLLLVLALLLMSQHLLLHLAVAANPLLRGQMLRLLLLLVLVLLLRLLHLVLPCLPL